MLNSTLEEMQPTIKQCDKAGVVFIESFLNSCTSLPKLFRAKYESRTEKYCPESQGHGSSTPSSIQVTDSQYSPVGLEQAWLPTAEAHL